jgi:hypothetical protein|tara:strand:- start:3193 stop:3378 length:186 start_codon:yes stop_codon:yes gene_type:complete
MPYQIKKVGDKYKLYNLHKKEYVNKEYKSKQSAINSGMNFMRYRKEKPYLKGNKILDKKKK